MIANQQQTYTLEPGLRMTVSGAGATGSVVRLARNPGGGNSISTTAFSGTTLTFGPYGVPERFNVICSVGTITVALDVPNEVLGEYATLAGATFTGAVTGPSFTATP